jgi:hypothetical protein
LHHIEPIAPWLTQKVMMFFDRENRLFQRRMNYLEHALKAFNADPLVRFGHHSNL